MAKSKEVIKSTDLISDLRYQITNQIEGKSLLACIQCGVCSSGCTVSQYIDMQPHRIVACLLLGLKDKVLKSNAIWYCSLCHRCTERCPKNVDFSFILAMIRNMAVKEGVVPPEYEVSINSVLQHGFVIPYSGTMKNTIDRNRAKFNLPEIVPPNLDELHFIVKETGLEDILKKAKKGKKEVKS
jgi:heterodisulfide reductase subunit C